MSKLEKMTKNQLKQEIVMLNMEVSALVDKLNLTEQNYIASEKAADARIEELEKENKELKAELEPYKAREAIQKSNDASIIRVDNTIRINEKWEMVDENGNRVGHTTFYYAN